MTAEEFQRHVAENASGDLDLNYAIIGICGEAGECAEWHKKFNLRGNIAGQTYKDDLLLELGDVLFYLTRAAALNGWDLSLVMDTNKAKLDARKGKGFKQIV